jgi:DNA-binding NarL/FixJ family response regulator
VVASHVERSNVPGIVTLVSRRGEVHAGDTIIAPELAQKMLNTFESSRSGSPHLAPPPLTERELEVIRALAQGMSDRQIARSLDISEKTVRNHTSNIYRKRAEQAATPR